MKGARRKCFLTIVLVALMLLQCFAPFSYMVGATTGNAIKLNDELYDAIKTNLINQNIMMSYSDDNSTITITDAELQKVTYLDLSNSLIYGLNG